jgi:putative cell wall-binding protein
MRVRQAVGFVAGLCGVVAALLVPASPAQSWTRAVQRIAGVDRYQTSVDIANAYLKTAPAAVIVSGESFPDGLAAGPLAALLGGPVLLTQRDTIPQTVLDELRTLQVTNVVIVGGQAAVSDAVATAITTATAITPERISGTNRYETAANVAARFPAAGAVAYVASGVDFPDALAAGAAAAGAGAPLLRVDHPRAPPAATAALSRLQPAEVRVLGGASAVSEDVATQLRAIVPNLRRIAGNDRYGTAQALAGTYFEGTASRPAEALVATGLGFPDALAAAPLAARRGAPIVLTGPTCAPQPTVDVLEDMSWPDVTVIGGATVVSASSANIVPCSPVPDGLVAPGLRLTTEVLPGPTVVHLVTLDRSQGYDLRVVPTTGRVNGTFQTTGLGRKLLSLIAINGDFFDGKGEPTHALARGGRLLRWPGSLVDALVAFDPDKATYGYLGEQHGGAEIDLGTAEPALPLGLVNMRAPAGEELAMLTPEWTRTFLTGTWCRAVLASAGAPQLEVGGAERTIQPGTVVSAGCSADPVPRASDVLVAAPGSAIGARLAELQPGSTANVRWKLHPSSQGVLDAVGANILLVTGGQPAADLNGSSPFLRPREARTAIAQTADGRILIAVVDKRAGWSVGMTPRELADHLLALGAVDAANLDGGGSSALAVRGVLANRPADGVERAVNTGLVVVPHGTDVVTTARR